MMDEIFLMLQIKQVKHVKTWLPEVSFGMVYWTLELYRSGIMAKDAGTRMASFTNHLFSSKQLGTKSQSESFPFLELKYPCPACFNFYPSLTHTQEKHGQEYLKKDEWESTFITPFPLLIGPKSRIDNLYLTFAPLMDYCQLHVSGKLVSEYPDLSEIL